MGEGGGTAHFRVQSIVRVNRQRLPSKAFLKRLGWFLFGARLLFICIFKASPRKVYVGSQLHLGRHPALEEAGSRSELLIAVLP